MYSPDYVWTFEIYQHFVDMAAYELDMIHRFDLTRHLDGQPLQFMIKDRCVPLFPPTLSLFFSVSLSLFMCVCVSVCVRIACGCVGREA